jgi:acetylornithine deacetylase/succinyl-diaminopimelate desuccinylase-like protein
MNVMNVENVINDINQAIRQSVNPLIDYLRPSKISTMKAWKDYLDKNKDRFLEELLELLRIPSVSARTEHKNDMVKCAEAVKQRMLEAGADLAEIIPTDGHPIVYGEKIIDPAKPTVLVYGHYDVQPADPLELWKSGPFDPVIKDGKIYARGSCDDKGLPISNSVSRARKK